MQAITLKLPETLYQQVQQLAEKRQRPLADILLEVITAVIPIADKGTPQLKGNLAHLAYLNDAALWQVARATLAPEQQQRLQALHDLQKTRLLSSKEQIEEQQLVTLYRETILVRAQAAVLLQQRGYNVSDPSQFTP